MDLLKKHWQTVIWVVVFGMVVYFAIVLFPARRIQLVAESGLDAPVADAWFFYTPDQLADALAHFSPEGRRYYAMTELTLDLAFPLLYGSWLFMALSYLTGKLLPPASPWRSLHKLPLFLIGADIGENCLLVISLLTYPPAAGALMFLTAFASATKWLLGLACLILLAGGGLALLVKVTRKGDG